MRTKSKRNFYRSQSTRLSLTTPLLTQKNITYSSTVASFFNLWKSLMTLGILTLPYDLNSSGNLGFLLQLLLVLAMTIYCYDLYLTVIDDLPGSNRLGFNQFVDRVSKGVPNTLLKVFQIAGQYSLMIPAMSFILHMINEVACAYSMDSLCNEVKIQGFIIFMFVSPLMLIDKMHYFAFGSTIGIVCLVTNLSVICFTAFTNNEDAFIIRSVEQLIPEQFRLMGFVSAFGSIVYSFESVGAIFEIRSDMLKPKEFRRLMIFTNTWAAVIFFIFAHICATGFGDSARKVVLFNLDANNQLTLVSYIFYSISLLVSVPLLNLPAQKTLEDFKILKQMRFKRYRWKKIAFRISLLFVMISIVTQIRNLGALVNFCGSIVFVTLTFIAPVLIYQDHFGEDVSKNQTILNYSILTFGCVFGIYGAYQSIQDIF